MTPLTINILENCEGFQDEVYGFSDYRLFIPPLQFFFNVEEEESDGSTYYIVTVSKDDTALTTREITTLAQLQKLAVEYLDREIEIKE